MSDSKELVKVERRSNGLGPMNVGTYTPLGVKRIEAKAETFFRAHDDEFALIEDPGIQSWYSLLDHSYKVSIVAAGVAEVRGCSLLVIEEARVGGFLHDVGKLHPACHIFRQNRILNPYEKLVMDTHADISGAMLIERMMQVRPEDREFLHRIYPRVLYHHRPWMILEKDSRQMGYDLMMSDIFVSLMETRHRPGLTQFQAIEALGEIITLHKADFRADLFPHEIVIAKRAIEKKYGFDLKALELPKVIPPNR